MPDQPHKKSRISPEDASAAPKTVCPVCQTPISTGEHHPFCSKRCRQIDLGRWLDGSYKITRPIEQSDLEEGE